MVAAIVVNWNGRAYLADCVAALLAQDPPPDDVVLVDNGSDDGSRAFVAERFPSVRIVDTGANLGPAHARNLGLEAATDELLVFVDNDVVLEPGALAALCAEIRRHPNAAFVQARSLCADDPTIVHYDHADLHFLGTLVLHNWLRQVGAAPWPTGPVGAGIALCFATRRSVLRELGGFDAKMFILYEDTELCWRLRMCGHEIRLAPEALCRHRGGTAGLSRRGAADPYPARRAYLHCRNRWFVLAQCMRWRTFVLTLPAQVVYALMYLAFATSRGHLLPALRGHGAALASWRQVLARRRSVQRRRTVPDRALLVALPMTPNPGLADRGAKALLRRASDGFFACYWRAVRRLCG